MVPVLSESDEEADAGGEAGEIDFLETNVVRAHRRARCNVPRFGPQCPARTHRPLRARERLRHRRTTSRVECVGAYREGGEIDEVAGLVEAVVHGADAGADVRHERVRHPRIATDLAA